MDDVGGIRLTSAKGDKRFARTAFGAGWFWTEVEQAHRLCDMVKMGVTMLLSTIGCEGEIRQRTARNMAKS